MAQLNAFNFITLDGYYKDVDHNIGWHQHGAEEGEFSADNLKAGNILLFGRVTYEMMAGFWPSPMAAQSLPAVAAGMNKARKIVVSRTLKKADWNNTTIIADNAMEEIQKLKETEDHHITLLGSGSLLTQLSDAGLVDGYQIMIDPIAIGKGHALFGNLKAPLQLELTGTRTFKSGVVLLNYQKKATG